MDDLVRAAHRLNGCYVPYLQPYWDEDDLAAAAKWIKGGALEDVRDKLVHELKMRFPQSESILLTDTGKSALCLALGMLGLGSGDEVIVPSFCCLSVILSIVRAQCAPVLVDCDENFNISEKSTISALSSRTKAIVVPHMFGLQAASLEALVALARQRDIVVIEDVAQAYGLTLAGGAPAGSLGDAAIFSTGLGKPLMGPAGGWVMLNRPGRAMPRLEETPLQESRSLVANFLSRFTGPRWRRGIAEIAYALPWRLRMRMRARAGFDLKVLAEKECRLRQINVLDGWLAARQIKRIERNIELRRENARRWKAVLAAANIQCSTPPDDANICAAFPLRFEGAGAPQAASRFRRILERGGVSTESCYTPAHLRGEGRGLSATHMPVCESAWRRVFSVPVRPNLLPADWDRIEKAVAASKSTDALSSASPRRYS
jgi:dTDP-4-amino-4,6-dideoxygalactose transaminase